MSILLGAHRTPSLIHCQKDMEERRKYALYCCLSLICSRSSLSKIATPIGIMEHYPSSRRLLVENNGFEPLTPCLQSRCSSQLS